MTVEVKDINKVVQEEAFGFVKHLHKSSVNMVMVELTRELMGESLTEKVDTLLDDLISVLNDKGVLAVYTNKENEQKVFKILLEKGLFTLSLLEHHDNPTFSTRREPLSVIVVSKVKSRTKSYTSGLNRKFKLPYTNPLFLDTKLPRQLITEYTQEGDLVYIPFAKKGDEIVACMDLKRNWIANETGERNLVKMNTRIEKLEKTLQRRKRRY